MKLLVTGGAGFIGGNFVHYWTKHHPEDSITVLDKLTYAGNKKTLESIIDKLTFIEGDIANEQTASQAMKDIDTIVHFAAESHVDRSIADPYVFTRTNALGTHMLLQAAKEACVQKFHHISTDEVFGSIPLDQHYKFNESTPYNPHSPYAASKAASDHLVRAYGDTYGLPFTISNCSNNFGPYMYPEKFIPRSIIRLLRGDNIRIYTPGNQIRDWLHVEDHCRAIDAILSKGISGETYCIGGMTEEISNIEVAQLIVSIMGLSPDRIEMVTDRAGHDVKYAVDWTKINNTLHWKPLHDFTSWLSTTIDWYKHNEQWWGPLADESEQFYAAKGEKVL